MGLMRVIGIIIQGPVVNSPRIYLPSLFPYVSSILIWISL